MRDAPVVAPPLVNDRRRGNNVNNPCLTTHGITSRVKEIFRPRLSLRPYVLKIYFGTQLLIAKSKIRITHDFRVFFSIYEILVPSLVDLVIPELYAITRKYNDGTIYSPTIQLRWL